jgi:hypothetical protein
MSTTENIQQTVAFLRSLLPLDLYVTLGQGRGGHPLAAKARLLDVVDEDVANDRVSGHRYKNRVGVRVQYNGVVHRTLCSAGKDMRKSLREELYSQDAGVITFDSWHRTKVHLNGQIYRMKELIPPAVRRGAVALSSGTFLGNVPLERRDHHLHQVLRAGQTPKVVDGTSTELGQAQRTAKRRRTIKTERITVVSPIKHELAEQPIPVELTAVRDPQMALVEQSMTMLRETFPEIPSAPKMLAHIRAMSSAQLALLGIPVLIRAMVGSKN